VKRVLQAIILLVVAAAGYFLWAWTHPSPEKAILKQMEKLSETLVAKPGEGNFARAAAINKTLSFFTPNVYINGDGIPQVNESIQGQTELQQALFAARSRLDGAITFNEIHVIIGPDKTNARVNFHAVARLSGQNEPYSQDLKAQFENVDGKWLISRMDPIGAEIR
jgi:hypothetical protein